VSALIALCDYTAMSMYRHWSRCVCTDCTVWLQEIVGPLDDAFTLFYGKFRTNAPRIKTVMEQVEQRVDKSPEYVKRPLF